VGVEPTVADLQLAAASLQSPPVKEITDFENLGSTLDAQSEVDELASLWQGLSPESRTLIVRMARQLKGVQ
jgi:hypothetical protein